MKLQRNEALIRKQQRREALFINVGLSIIAILDDYKGF